MRVNCSICLWRSCNGNILDACNFCWNSIHQYSRRIGCFTSRNVNAYSIYRSDLLSKCYSCVTSDIPCLFLLCFMEFGNVLLCFFNCFHKCWTHHGLRLIYFSFGNTKFLELYPIKLLRILEQSLITILANFMNDIKYRLINFMIRICLRCRFWMLILCLGNNLHIHDFSTPFKSDRNVRICSVFVAKLALFTTSLVLICSKISTMQSAISIMGASSTEPFNLIVSTCMPFVAKYFFATFGYFEATFNVTPCSMVISFKLATTKRHSPNFKSSNSYISAPASKILSLPTMPISAAPSST